MVTVVPAAVLTHTSRALGVTVAIAPTSIEPWIVLTRSSGSLHNQEQAVIHGSKAVLILEVLDQHSKQELRAALRAEPQGEAAAASCLLACLMVQREARSAGTRSSSTISSPRTMSTNGMAATKVPIRGGAESATISSDAATS